MGSPTLVQSGFIFADDDNSDPDLCTFDTANTDRSGQEKTTSFMVRIQCRETAGNGTQSKNWQLYYNTANNPTTATQVQTSGGGGSTVIITAGTPTNGAACDTQKCGSQSETWQNGLYCEADETGKFILDASRYTEHQFAVEFESGATSGGDYYFFLRFNSSELDTYSSVGIVTVAVGSQTVTPTFIASGSAVSDPTLSTTVTVTPSAIASGSTVYNPTLTQVQSVTPTFIASGSVVSDPATSTGPVTVTPNAIPSGSTVPNPTISTPITVFPERAPVDNADLSAVFSPTTTTTVTVTPTPIASGSTVLAPTTSTGPVTTTPEFVASASTVPNPTLSTPVTVTPEAIGPDSAVPNPTTSTGPVSVTPELIASGSTVYNPTVTLGSGTQTVTPLSIASASTVPAPSITATVSVTPALLASASTVPNPTLLTTVTVTPNSLASASTVPAPTTSTGPVTTTPTFLASGSQVFAPTISQPGAGSQSVTPLFIASGSSVPAPTTSTGPVTVAPLFISSSSNVYAPVLSTSVSVTPAFIGSGSATFAPSIDTPISVVPAFISASSNVYPPALQWDQFATPTLIGSGSVVYQPSLTVGAILSVRLQVLVAMQSTLEGISTANGHSFTPALVTRRMQPADRVGAYPAIFVGEPPEDKDETIHEGRTEVFMPVRIECWFRDPIATTNRDATRVIRDIEAVLLADDTLGGTADDLILTSNETIMMDRPTLTGVAVDTEVKFDHDRSDPLTAV